MVSVWLGLVPDRDTLEAYLRRQSHDIGEPVNRFAADAGDWFYEPDHQRFAYRDEEGTLPELLAGEPRWPAISEAATSAWRALGAPPANAAILLFDVVLAGGAWPASSPVRYLGAFSLA